MQEQEVVITSSGSPTKLRENANILIGNGLLGAEYFHSLDGSVCIINPKNLYFYASTHRIVIALTGENGRFTQSQSASLTEVIMTLHNHYGRIKLLRHEDFSPELEDKYLTVSEAFIKRLKMKMKISWQENQ